MNNYRGTPSEPTERPAISLRELVAPLFRNRRAVVGTFAVVCVLAILVSWLWAADYYVATMQVVVEQTRTDPTVTAGQTGTVVNNRAVTLDQVTSEIALLQGEDMLKSVAASCGLDKSWSPSDIFLPSDPARRQAMKQENAARKLGKHLVVEAQKTSDVIDVSYGRAGSPETPACVLQNLSKLYIEKHVQLLRPAGSAGFFAEETARSKQALQDSEAKLVDFSAKTGVAAPDLLRTDLAAQVALAESVLNQTQQAVAADEQRMSNLKKQMSSTPARSSTTESTIPPSLLLENLNASLLASEVKRTELVLKYEPSYPLVKAVDQEIAQTKAAIAQAEADKYLSTTTDRDTTYEFLRQDMAKTEADLSSARAAAATLVGNIRKMHAQMVDLDRAAVQQAALLRDSKTAETSYLLYLGKREEERTSDALDKKGIANVAIAVPPTVPALPAHSPLLVLALGMIAACFAGIGAGYAADHIDTSFRTPEEVSKTLSMPVLAVVPKKKVA
jgi:uncharacterized protein involved in exopolysaccharide biosynthesis